MKFTVRKASDIFREEKPCSNATLVETQRHREWFVEISGIEDLRAIYDESENSLIIDFSVNSIIIYDDYVE